MNEDPVPGFTAICVIISNILGLKYESVVALPFLAPTFILISLLIVRKIFPLRTIAPSFFIMGAWMLFLGIEPVLFCHTIGLALWFIVAYLSIIRLQQNKLERTANIRVSILLFILIISINLVSYKLMFFTIFFLIGLELIVLFEKYFNESSVIAGHKKFNNFILVGIVLALTFNWFFYKSFIPNIRTAIDHPIEGILKAFSIFMPTEEITPISTYYYVGDVSRIPLYLLLYILIAISLMSCLVIILSKKIKRQPLSIGEISIISIIFPGVIIFIVYNSIGFTELSFLLTAGILGYPILLGIKSKFINKIFAVCVFILFIVTILMNLLAFSSNNYGGQTNQNEFLYLNRPAEWYNYYRYEYIFVLSSDRLTGGYFALEASKDNMSYIPYPISAEDILFILEPNKYPPIATYGENNRKDYIINYNENSFSAVNWVRYKSWSNYIININCNIYINNIYTSKFIDICI